MIPYAQRRFWEKRIAVSGTVDGAGIGELGDVIACCNIKI